MEADLNIMIIESDPYISEGLKERVNHLGFSRSCNASPERPIDQLEALNPDLAILGPSLEEQTCLECLHKLRIIDPFMPVLTSSEENCLSEISTPPFEGVHFLSQDLGLDEISRVIEQALKHRAETESRPDFPSLIGQSPKTKLVRQKIRKVCDKDITVLINGETGTGKELIARSIHYHSLRSSGPLVKVNCGALPDELLESEVFGFQTGAFTGAYKDKPGRLEMANRGTLFVDEIGDLSLSLQVKFLQVMEDKAFSRLGGTKDKIIDARVVAATNADIPKKVREGTFRKDLFYRVNVVTITAPSLRERKADIPLLTHYFLNKYCYEFKKEVLDIPNNIAKLFMAYQWPGNVRELENVIRRAIALRDWSFVYEEFDLEKLSREEDQASSLVGQKLPPVWSDDKLQRVFRDSDFSLKKISKAYVSEAERQAILSALKETQWNRKKAAQLLQVSYKTLLNRLAELDLKP
jgi:two-component system response regulator AtoC